MTYNEGRKSDVEWFKFGHIVLRPFYKVSDAIYRLLYQFTAYGIIIELSS